MNMKEVVWRWDCGVYVPFCPYCNKPAYMKDLCGFCGKTYKWVDGKDKPTEVTKGEFTITQTTNNHIYIYKNDRLIIHAQCSKKMNEEELLKELDKYEVRANENQRGE